MRDMLLTHNQILQISIGYDCYNNGKVQEILKILLGEDEN